MLVNSLKWTQLVVAIAATILAGLIWPGIMVVIPVAFGLIYVAAASGAIRDRRISMWLACLMSAGVAVLSTAAVVSSEFAGFQLNSGIGNVPTGFVSATGDAISQDSVSDSAAARFRQMNAAAAHRDRLAAALLLIVSFGSCAVVLMHGFAWRWMIYSRVAASN